MDLFFLIGGHYEKKGGEITKYYGVYPEPRRRAGASRIAVRKYTVPQSTTLNYLTGDHLGSTSLAVNASTGDVVQTRYKPWGEVRWTSENKTLPTRYTFTGQYSYISDSATDLTASASFGLMFYNARWYDPMLGRFAQADTVMPGGVQGLDRYAYVNNSPVMYTDPTGHCTDPTDYACRQSAGNAGNNAPPLPPLLEFEHEKGANPITLAEQAALNASAQDVANALAREINSHCTQVQMENGQCHHVTSQEAFYGVYDGPVEVRRVNRDCNCAMQWIHDDPNDLYIAVYNDIPTQYILDNPRLFVHELGHAFLWFSNNNNPIPGNALNANGFYQMEGGYEYRLEDTPREFFADMFLGWVYGKWEVFWGTTRRTPDGNDKARYMNKNMPLMINQAMGW